MKFVLIPPDSYVILRNLSLIRKMPPTMSLELTRTLVKKFMITFLTESENLLINALNSKVSSSPNPSVVDQI
jgi:hypothetical protein